MDYREPDFPVVWASDPFCAFTGYAREEVIGRGPWSFVTGEAVYAASGNPYGTSVTADAPGVSDEALEAIRHQARRLVRFAEKLRATGEHVGVPLVDSLVVGFDGRYTSLVERGLL